MSGEAMRRLERVLWIVGLVCLGWYVFESAEAASEEQRAREEIEQVIANPKWMAAPEPSLQNRVGQHLVGLLEIPRLRLSTPVVEGDDKHALRGTAGHLPDTPRPWEHGNTAIAAHRDGLFRPLQHIRAGDEIRLHTPHGEFRYIVRGTGIVKPTDLSVLKASDTATLTLLTCYPFYFVGPAPKRFFVRADLVARGEERATESHGNTQRDEPQKATEIRRGDEPQNEPQKHAEGTSHRQTQKDAEGMSHRKNAERRRGDGATERTQKDARGVRHRKAQNSTERPSSLINPPVPRNFVP